MIFIVADELKEPLSKIGYETSSRLLLELKELRGSANFDILVVIAECELQLGRGREEESVRNARDLIAASCTYSALDVRKRAKEMLTSKLFVRAFILRRISIELENSPTESPDGAVVWFKDRIYDMVKLIAEIASTV